MREVLNKNSCALRKGYKMLSQKNFYITQLQTEQKRESVFQLNVSNTLALQL